MRWEIGAALAVVGNVLINLGANTLKLAHNTRDDLSDRARQCSSASVSGDGACSAAGAGAGHPVGTASAADTASVSPADGGEVEAAATAAQPLSQQPPPPQRPTSLTRMEAASSTSSTATHDSDTSRGVAPWSSSLHHAGDRDCGDHGSGGDAKIGKGTDLAEDTGQPRRQQVKWRLTARQARWVWWLGFCAFAAGSTINFWALGFAAQSLIAALGSVQFITNVAFSVLLLGEKVTWRTAGATVSIVAGNVVLVLSADHAAQMYDAHELCDLFLTTPYIVYNSMLAALLLALTAWLPRLFRQRRDVLNKLQAVTPTPYVVSSSPTVPRSVAVHLPLAYAVQGAIIGTQSVTLAKSVSELLRLTLMGDSQLGTPVTYMFVSLWVATMLFWIHRMNQCLKLFAAQFIVPVLQVVWTVLSIAGGGVYFREFEALQWPNACGMVAGVSIILLGVWLLAPNTAKAPSTRTTSASGQASTAPADHAANSSHVPHDAALQPDHDHDHDQSPKRVSSLPLMHVAHPPHSAPNAPPKTPPSPATHAVQPPVAGGYAVQHRAPLQVQRTTPAVTHPPQATSYLPSLPPTTDTIHSATPTVKPSLGDVC